MIQRLIISAIAVWLTASFLTGVEISPWWANIIVALVLGLVNTFIKPVVKLFALPITFITLGLFGLIINALMIVLTAWLAGDYFVLDGFWTAFLFSIILSVVTWLLNVIFGD